jgi:hypothetical protein
VALKTDVFDLFMLIGIETFFKLYVLKPNPILPTQKYQGSTIDDKPTQVFPDRLSQKSPDVENVSGIGIEDMFVIEKMIVLTFLDFPDPDKAHRSSTIDVISLWLLSMSILLYFSDTDGDRLSPGFSW